MRFEFGEQKKFRPRTCFDSTSSHGDANGNTNTDGCANTNSGTTSSGLRLTNTCANASAETNAQASSVTIARGRQFTLAITGAHALLAGSVRQGAGRFG